MCIDKKEFKYLPILDMSKKVIVKKVALKKVLFTPFILQKSSKASKFETSKTFIINNMHLFGTII